jgi:hypothetical protein
VHTVPIEFRLGTIHGIQSLPGDLLNGLECRDLITRVADDFADVFIDDKQAPERYPTY